ncbi:hypothetical protein [uncultured Roseibium sp.]|uniref:tetratricopeptide repeat protein n=1 Tax=uncultured Roseibium sp. TaxID=1936171 RepID=UPI0032161F54
MLLRALLVVLAMTAFGSFAHAQSDQGEITFWQSVQDSKDPAELEAYLQAYPEGKFSVLARIRINKLKVGAEPLSPGQPASAASNSDLTADQPPVTECDRLAAQPSDPRKVAEGVRYTRIRIDAAIAACRKALESYPGTPRFLFQLGRALEQKKQLAEAYEAYHTAAEAGYPMAMVNMAFMLAYGDGVAKDGAEAARWFRKAIDEGEPEAMTGLGDVLMMGDGIAKDEIEAIKWYRRAASLGEPYAMLGLGLSYETGEGVAKDLTEAVRWYRKAADLGEADSMTRLGDMFAKGEGVAKNETEAAQWYLKAAELDEAAAMRHLAEMYAGGRGVPKDPAKAAEWKRRYDDILAGRRPSDAPADDLGLDELESLDKLD